MKLTARRLGLLATLATVAAVALLSVAARTSDAQGSVVSGAPVDINGTWRVTFSSLLVGDCKIGIHEDGASLTAVGPCVGYIGGLRLSGSVDQTVGRLRLEGNDGDFELEGTVSPNGETITGTFQDYSRPRTAFTAHRDSSIELVDLSGDWHFELPSDPPQECTFHIDQPFSDAAARFACAAVSDVQIAGSVNPVSGSFYLSDPNLHVENYFSGRSSTDGRYLTAELVYGSDKWRFTAVRQDSHLSGLVALSNAGQQAVGEPFTLQVGIVGPPAGGYNGFHIELAWEGGGLEVNSKSTSQCGSGGAMIAPDHGSIDCSYGSARQSAGTISEVSATCKRLGYATIDLSGTTLTSPDGPSVTPSVIGARIFCWTPVGSNPGDSNCDAAINSIDGALVLQHEAGLLAITGCLSLSDLNFDDEVNSIDAAIILQYAAGLFRIN